MKAFQNNHGIITVFVTLIMVPVVVFTGMFVDVARFKLCSSQAIMAADIYGETVLGEYDNVLKELYGLFSVTQNTEGIKAIEDLKKYTSYSFDPNGDDTNLTGFMPYENTEVSMSYTKINESSLGESSVMLTQVGDFMKFRIIEEILDEANILNAVDQFRSLDGDTKVMTSIADIGTDSMDVLKEVLKYYEILKKIDSYPSYLDSMKGNYDAYFLKLSEICGSLEYKKYVYYLENRVAIDAAYEKKIRIEETVSAEDEIEETLTENEKELIKQYVDVDDYTTVIDKDLTEYSNPANKLEGTIINFISAEDEILALSDSAKALSDSFTDIKEKVEEVNKNIEECSESVKESVKEDIKDLDKIISLEDDFTETYDFMQPIHDDISVNQNNYEMINDGLTILNELKSGLILGEIVPSSIEQNNTPIYDCDDWYDFREDKNAFYLELEILCESGENDKKDDDKNAGNEKIDEANTAKKDAEEAKIKNEDTSARNISSDLSAELSIGKKSVEPGDEISFFNISNNLSEVTSIVIDRFLLASYDFGMFSSRVSGIEEKDDQSALDTQDTQEKIVNDGMSDEDENNEDNKDENKDENSEDEYADYSLTNVKMSKDINYLYGAELEYLLAGHDNSVENLNTTRNYIWATREIMNFTSTYMIDEVDDAIKAAANAAELAVCATGFGPLVRFAVSAALRLAFASMESFEDWKQLKERNSVLLLKRELDDLACVEKFKKLTGGLDNESSSNEKSDGIKLSYENYLYVLMFLLVDINTLSSRTSNLITLNVNQSQNPKLESETDNILKTLNFKMNNTVTAINSTCMVKMDFVILPDNFMNLFVKGTDDGSDIVDIINSKEEDFIGYSIIRGY